MQLCRFHFGFAAALCLLFSIGRADTSAMTADEAAEIADGVCLEWLLGERTVETTLLGFIFKKNPAYPYSAYSDPNRGLIIGLEAEVESFACVITMVDVDYAEFEADRMGRIIETINQRAMTRGAMKAEGLDIKPNDDPKITRLKALIDFPDFRVSLSGGAVEAGFGQPPSRVSSAQISLIVWK